MSRAGPSDDEPHGAGLPGHWPPGVPRHVPAATRSLWGTLCASAERVPDRAAIVFDDRATSYAALVRDAEALAGWLQQRAGVQAGDRVLLMAQNGPQHVTAHYAVFRADAVVVPVNAMWTAAEVGAVADDSGARVAVVAQALLPAVVPLVEAGRLASVLVIDEADAPNGLPAQAAPAGATAAPADIRALLGVRATPWHEALGAGLRPAEHRAGPADLCVLPYTSGTTGRPKGCRHTHATVQASNRAAAAWRRLGPDEVFLGVAPIFHMLGMQNGMHLPLQLGATVVMLPRWDREAALALIQRHRVTCWAAPPAMLLDFFSHPAAETADLSSLHLVNGGGAAMPAPLAERMWARWRLEYNEGYGLTETASFLHANPRGRGKPGSLGLPGPGVESRVVDTVTGAVLPPGEVGEIVTRGPQLMLGYWQRPDADREAFVEVEGRRWFRTGDLGLVDDEGYFFMRDRLKRMVVVSGYKVWPAEVEGLLHGHPAVHEACVVAVPDARSGEAVRALVVLRPGQALSAEDLIVWCRRQMAVYKAPRSVRFVDALPKSTTGKVLWRELQQREREAAAGDRVDDPAMPTPSPPGASTPMTPTLDDAFDFADRHVFVAGGSSGINLGIAAAFAERGARVAIASRSAERIASALVQLRRHGGPAEGWSADVRDPAAVADALASAHARFGEIDVLVSGAAGNFVAPALGMSPNGFKTVVDIDLLGTFNVLRAAHAFLRKPGASVINITAAQSFNPTPYQAHVCAAKAGVDMLTRTLAMEWGAGGIRINSILPGPIDDTEGVRRLAPDEAARERMLARIPLGRFGRLADVVNMALVLSSPLAAFVTGAIVPVDGGGVLSGSRDFSGSYRPRDA